MRIENCPQGVETLNIKDNIEWIDKVTCWVAKDSNYNIYVFQVVVEDENDLKENYSKVAASIATEFQADLEKPIERWNIYLIFQCLNSISIELKGQIEQDKYSSRKMVWDNMKDEEIGCGAYLEDRLFHLEIEMSENTSEEAEDLMTIIKRIDNELYDVLCRSGEDVDKQAAMYLGGGASEQKN